MCTDDQLLAPSGPSYVPPTVLHQGTSSGIGFVNLTENTGRPAVVFRINGRMPFGSRKRKEPVPVPGPARATINRKMCKLIMGLNCSRVEPATLLSVPLLNCSSPDNTSTAVIDLADEFTPVRPDHVDPGCTLVSLSTPSSASTTVSLRTRVVTLDSKVCKPLFQAVEDREKATKSGDNMLNKIGDLAETDEVLKDTLVDSKCCAGPTSLPNAKKRTSQTAEGMTGTFAMKTNP